jgi:hypothetical protein
MLLQGGTIAITGLPIDEAKFKTENKIVDEEIIKLLNVIFKLYRLLWINLNKRKIKRRRSNKLQRPKKRNDYLK